MLKPKLWMAGDICPVDTASWIVRACTSSAVAPGWHSHLQRPFIGYSVSNDKYSRALCQIAQVIVPEEPMTPQQVMSEHLAYNDDPNTTFLDDLCQEMHSLMTPPPSYLNLLIQLTIGYHEALLAGEQVDTPTWRATFRCEQIEKA
jgi:hypothetical protein